MNKMEQRLDTADSQLQSMQNRNQKFASQQRLSPKQLRLWGKSQAVEANLTQLKQKLGAELDNARTQATKWGPQGSHQGHHYRVLGAGSDVQAWADRNIASIDSVNGHEHRDYRRNQRRVIKQSMLDIPGGKWTDYLNQGWMQGGYDRGAMFRLVTPLSSKEAGQVNQARNPDALAHQLQQSKNRALFHSGEKRMTFYGQELVDAVGAGYGVHQDEQGRQSLMPKTKSAMLSELRSKVSKK